MNEQAVYGIFIPLITPFTSDNKLDIQSYHKYVTHLASYDIQGLVINGTTGESPTVQWEEVKQMVQITQDVLKEMQKKIPIVVGTGTNDTYSTVKRTELAAELGADAAMVVTPYYNRPTQEGIVEHFRMASSTGLPVLAYEIPARTGSRITVDNMRRILDFDGVIGLKDSSGGLELLSSLTKTKTKPVLCGEDVYFHTMLSQGAAGGMLASSHVHTDRFVEVYKRFASGDINGSGDSFNHLIPIIRQLFEEPAPAPIKWFLARQGIIANEQLRLPLMPASETMKQNLLNVISLPE